MFKSFFTKIFLIIALLFSCEKPLTDSSKKPPLSFTDVTENAGLAGFKHISGAIGDKWFPESMGSGCGFIDYNSDGWVDILLVGGGSWTSKSTPPSPSLFLYENNKDGTFKNVTNESGLGEIYTYGFGVCVADYDNDDDDDFFFTTIWNNYLFRNDGGFFINASDGSGLENDSLWSTTSIFFDANKDGFLDLFVGSYVNWSPENDIWCTLDGSTKNYCTPELYSGVHSRFYQNNGDGTFSNKTEDAGFLPSPGKMLGAAELDFNDDGWPDLAIASDTQRDLLYQNNGDGTFDEIGAISGVAYDENGRARAGMGIDVGVIDKSGKETIFVGNFSKEMISVFRHSNGQFFEDISAISKVGRPSLMTLTFGLFLLDVDLDGDLDLYTANGHVQIGIEDAQDGIFYREPSHLFLNDGNGVFSDIVPLIGGALSKPIVGRGAAYADYDNNGTLDILVTENNGPVHLIRNNNLNNYLRVKIKSINSNRDGIGAKLIAITKDNRMIRKVKTGSSFMSHSETTTTFGLGKNQMVDSLYVYWPNNKVDIFLDIQSSQEILIVEEKTN
mgnify:FL=1